MDDVTKALFTTQIAAMNLAVRSLIATHPDPQRFAEDFRQQVAVVQTSGALLESGEGARDLFREQCESFLQEAGEK